MLEKKREERRNGEGGREGGSISDSICRYKSSGTRNTLTASTTTAQLASEKKGEEGERREEEGAKGRKEEGERRKQIFFH